jgi:hypothetical protein
LEGLRGLRVLQITGLEVDAKNENSEYRQGEREESCASITD